MPSAPNNSIPPNIDHLVNMLRVACEDADINDTLEKLLSQPEDHRQIMIQELLAHLHRSGAPKELIEAFVPLLNDGVADTAWRVIYRCRSAS